MTYLALTLALSLAAFAGWTTHTISGMARQYAQDLAANSKDAEAERQILLERIQRPERVPVETAADPSPEPLHIPYDDDEAYTEYVQRNGLDGDDR